MKKKLLLISPIFVSKGQEGHAPFMQNLIEAYINNGLDVSLLAKKGRDEKFLKKFFSYIYFYIRILFTNTTQFDYVQISFPTLVYPVISFKRFGKAKIIIRFHGEDLVIPGKSFKSSILKKFSENIIRKGDLIVVPSKYFYNIVKNKYSKANVYIYPSGGVNLKNFYPIRKNYKNNNILNLGYIGRLDYQKGLQVLIKAISYIEDIKIHLIIIGDGPQKKEFLNLVENYKIDYVYYGTIPNNKLVNYYNEFDIFIFPTMREAESFGNVGIESMACGIPVIGSNIGGLTDYLVDGFNGLLFTPGDSRDLSDKIIKYNALSIEQKIELSNNAIKTASKYESNFLTSEFINYLNNIK